VNLSQRSYQKELLDGTGIPFQDIKRNMRELEFINSFLGGHAVTLAGMQKLIQEAGLPGEQELLICEIGCGGGDNLKAIQNWCNKKKVRVRLMGIDINPDCIEVAASNFNDTDTSFIARDYIKVTFNRKPDVIFSSLFCHHFTDQQLVEMLGWMRDHARIGFFINDLHRHSLAYHSIKILTGIFSGSYLVKNDAPLSVLRGFTRKEWMNLLQAAGISQYSIEWKWAFRYLITTTHKVSFR
jgi:2-polyprenyl-3-methyl-5-hydroxy-6-metoxy-1,4-benzoquinol methylase